MRVHKKSSESGRSNLRLLPTPSNRKERKKTNKKIILKPSEWVSQAMMMPTKVEVDGREETVLKKFSFDGRGYLAKPYNTNAKKILLMFARQSEKSTLLGNISLSYMTLLRHFRCLFVSPTQQQTETFSRDRIAAPIDNSELLKALAHGPGTKDNVLYKLWTTKSDITLRYAFLNADRIRGISADMLLLDELQDILVDCIPVIEEALSHSPYKIHRYSGTPKSLENTIAWYWENFSTKNEWMIPCDSCGSKTTGRFWNIAGPKNVGLKSLVCERCDKQIYPQHPEACWASMNPHLQTEEPFEGYRVSQLIVPWIHWPDILEKVKRYSRQKLYNEVYGLGYDIGDRPLNISDVEACSNPALIMPDLSVRPKRVPGVKYYVGIDHGTGENASFTLIFVGAYLGGRFRIVYAHRCEGEETDPELTMKIIFQIIEKWKPARIGADYGGGYDRNTKLINAYGIRRVIRYQYANASSKIQWQSKLGRFVVRRNDVLKDLFGFIKKGTEFEFPNMEQFRFPFGKDMCNMKSEFSISRNEEVIDKVPGTTDDSLHALLYCFMASMGDYPRPDFIMPTGYED